MIVLGFDTATSATAVGLRLADETALQVRDDPEGDERPGHATRLLPLASALLSEAGLGWRDLTRIAVGVGPGTFTGLRIGVATARGIAQSLGLELVGVSSLAVLAHAARVNTQDEKIGVLAAIDARRGEAFVAAYDGELELVAPQATAPEEIGKLLERAEARGSSERWIAVGDGALRYRDAFQGLGVHVPGEDSSLHLIDARVVCCLGLHPTNPPTHALVGDAQVVPDYRRRPDAEIALEGVAS